MIIRFDEFEIDPDGLELRRHASPVKADAVVLRLLRELVVNAGRLVTKEHLIARVWEDRAVSENVISVAIARLRKTLGQEKGGREFVLSVHGRGYRFVRPVAVEDTTAAPVKPPELRGLPFVGRGRVLAQLSASVKRIDENGGGICVLAGEAGIGKTSLAEVVEGEASRAGALVVWGHCRESGDTPPLWPFIQLLRDVLERAAAYLDEPRLASAIAELKVVLPDLGSRDRAARGGDDTIAGDQPVTHRLFDAVLRVLSRLAERTPCVLVVDDLHRADSASLELLRYVVDEIARTRLLVLATLRTGVTPEAPASGHLAYVLGHRNTTRVLLERLEESEVRAYVNAALGSRDDALAHTVFVKSEGNPFFMVEFARLLRARGPADPAPRAALDLLRQRVSRLDAVTREVVSIAAVIGTRFDLALLGEVSDLPPAKLMEILDDAVAAEVVTTISDSNTTFRFGHDLLRAVMYDDLGTAERRSLHLRVLGALERRSANSALVPPADLAHHAHSALPEGDPRRVVRHCRAAAAAAAERRAYADAVRHTRHAREALTLVPNPSPRLQLNLLLSHALFARICSAPEFEAVVRDALHSARAQGQPGARARAALLLDLHTGFPALEGARAALEEARDELPESDETLPAVLAKLATSAPIAYDAHRSEVAMARAAELERRCPSVLAASNVRSAELFLCGGPADRERSTALAAELSMLCEEHPSTLSVTPVLVDLHRAIVAAQEGSAEDVETALDRAARRCRELGHHELGWHAERFRILSRVNAGHREAATEALREHHRLAERESLVGTGPFVAYDEVVVLASASSPPSASTLGALAANSDDLPSVWSWKTRALVSAGRPDSARASLRRHPPATLERLPRDRDYLGTLGALTRAAVALGERDYLDVLEKLLAPWSDRFAVNVTFFCEGSVSELLRAITSRNSI